MTSTTTSSDITLEIKNLYLTFDLDIQKGHTIRDVFVGMFKNPLSSILGKSEVHPVLEDINLTVRKGDIVGIIGENGSGKTSLCRCVAGMIPPQQGKVINYGSVQAVFSTASALHYALTGRENAYLLAELMFPYLSKTKITEVVEEALVFSELGKFLEAPFFTYSRGMQARLFLSIVTAHHSDLLILDEVYDGADEFFQNKMEGRMKKLLENSGSVLFISHNAELVTEICNRAFVLHKRKCIYDGANLEKGIALYKSLHQGGYQTG